MLLKILLYAFACFHPFYVSVIDLAYNENTRSLEVSIKVFTDDFEAALRQNFPNSRPDLMRDRPGSLEDSLINKYVKQKLGLTINGQAGNLQYVGYEKQEESVWAYFEIIDVPAVKTIGVSATLLFEYKKEQINIIHAKVGNEKKSHRLDNPESKVTLNF